MTVCHGLLDKRSFLWLHGLVVTWVLSVTQDHSTVKSTLKTSFSLLKSESRVTFVDLSKMVLVLSELKHPFFQL